MKIEQLYEIFLQHPTVSTDSRTCREGGLFFALKGANFNGNEYAHVALQNGAAYAVVDDPRYVTGEKTILVEDVLQTMQMLAHHHRKQLDIPIIAITGTNGKTTTKELVAAVLSQKYNVVYTRGNLNNHIGVPLTLLELKTSTRIGVIEIGANHVGEVAMLAKIVAPNLGIVTNIGRAHLEGFGSFENIIRAKTELFDYFRMYGGKVFVHIDDPLIVAQAEGLPMLTYGQTPSAFLSGMVLANNPFLSVEYSWSDKRHRIRTNLIGAYNFANIMAAIAVGCHMDVKPNDICKALQEYVPTNNRSQCVHTSKGNILIVDAYNANPTSMMAAIANFEALEHPAKYLILGDMMELGEESFAEHKKVLERVKQGLYQKVFLVGGNWEQLKGDIFLNFRDVSEVSSFLRKSPIQESAILLKGSRGVHLEGVLQDL